MQRVVEILHTQAQLALLELRSALVVGTLVEPQAQRPRNRTLQEVVFRFLRRHFRVRREICVADAIERRWRDQRFGQRMALQQLVFVVELLEAVRCTGYEHVLERPEVLEGSLTRLGKLVTIMSLYVRIPALWS